MAFSHGSLAKLAIDPAGGTAYTDISDYLQEASPSVDIDTNETTTLGKTAKVYIPGLEDGSFKLSGLYDPVIDALLDSCKRVIATFRYRPTGAGTGKPEFTGKFVMSSYGIETTADDVATIEADLQVSDAITRTTQP